MPEHILDYSVLAQLSAHTGAIFILWAYLCKTHSYMALPEAPLFPQTRNENGRSLPASEI